MFAQHGDGAGLWRIEIDMQVADKIVVHALKFIPANFGDQGGRLRVNFALGIVTTVWRRLAQARLRRKSCTGVPQVRTGGLAI